MACMVDGVVRAREGRTGICCDLILALAEKEHRSVYKDEVPEVLGNMEYKWHKARHELLVWLDEAVAGRVWREEGDVVRLLDEVELRVSS